MGTCAQRTRRTTDNASLLSNLRPELESPHPERRDRSFIRGREVSINSASSFLLPFLLSFSFSLSLSFYARCFFLGRAAVSRVSHRSNFINARRKPRRAAATPTCLDVPRSVPRRRTPTARGSRTRAQCQGRKAPSERFLVVRGGGLISVHVALSTFSRARQDRVDRLCPPPLSALSPR